MTFDLAGARREGYSDAEIAAFLASRSGFDIAGARREGYEDGEIISFLMRPQVSASEIERASRPARMTLSRGGQPQLAADEPPSAEQPARFGIELSGETLDQLERGYRGLKQSIFAVDVAASRRALEVLDRVERGERVQPIDDPFGFRVMSPERRAQTRQRLEAGYLDGLRTIATEAAKISELYHDPAAQEAIAAANRGEWRRAWQAFAADPMGVVKDLTLANAAQVAPMAALGVAGAAIKGVPGLLLGFAGGSLPVDYAQSLTDYLADQGIDLRDYRAVDRALREPGFLDRLQTYAAAHATGVAAGDAISAGAMRPITGGLRQAARAAARNVALGVAGESGGEAAGQILGEGQIKPGDVIAEGLAAGPLVAGGTVAHTAAAVRARSREARAVERILAAPSDDAAIAAAMADSDSASAEAAVRVPLTPELREHLAPTLEQPASAPEPSLAAPEADPNTPTVPPPQSVAPAPPTPAAEAISAPDVSSFDELRLRLAATYSGDADLRRAATAELARRTVDEAPGAATDETLAPDVRAADDAGTQVEPGVPPRAVAPEPPVRVFGRSLDRLSDAELAAVGATHRAPEIRLAARAELDRRAARGSEILGRPAAHYSTRALLLAMRVGTPRIREIARAELSRRGEAPAVARYSTEPDGHVQTYTQPSQAIARHTIPPSVPPSAPQNPAVEERAAVGIVLTPPYSGAGQEPVADVGRARPDAIRQAIRDLFRVPINEGGFRQSRDTLGIYKVRPRTIRVRNQNDISVIAHELGHHLSETSRPIREARKAFDAELRSITPYAADQRTPALQREEGMAEFVRLYLTEPAQAQAKAPGFFREFNRYIEEHGFKSAVDEVAGAIRDWQNLPPADRILAKVGEAEPEFRRRWNLDRILFEVFDNWLPLKRMVADLKPDIAPSADPFKLAHLLSGDAAIIEDWLLRETVPFDFARRANLQDRGKPLAEILRPVGDRQREFGAYLIAKRANELLKRGKEHLYSADEIAAGLRLETPEFKAAAEEIYRYQDELLQYAVEGGLLSERVAAKFRQFPYYVPFFRVGERIGQRGDIFKAIRGGTENLRDPIANIIENTVRIIHATNRNHVLAKAHELARSVPGGGRWLEDVPMPERAVKLQTRKIIEQLREQGVEIDEDTAENLATTQTFFVKNPFGDDRERIIVVRREGRPYALQVNDEMLWHALERFEPVDMGLVEKVLSVPADILRAGIVLSPDFMARNFARDTLSGFLQSKKGIIPVFGTLDGFREVATRSDAARLYRAFGGAFGDMWRADRGFERRLVERMARRGGFDPRTILTPRGLISLLHRIGSVSEAGTRVAEFKRTAREGDIDSLIEAAYNAREVSVDFGMHGHSRTIRFLTRITVFMNPALQGYYKAVRTGKTQPMTTLLRGSLLAAASIALFLRNRDEDWYDEIEQWEKNVYWHLDIGLRDERGQVIPLRIPKPFEWGGVFGSIPEALAQVAIEQHGERFAKRLASILDDVFTFRVIPSALVVPAELWANKNQFTGRPIVPESKERLAPELQTTPSTSTTARTVGEMADISPAKIDHAIRGLFGTLGTYAVMLTDQALRLGGADSPALPLPWPRYPVVRAFFRDPSGSNSRHVNEFYELLREARQADASLKHMSEQRAAEYYRQHRDAIERRRDAEQVAREMARLRRENEELRHSRDMPDTQRLSIIVENNREIRWLAREFMRDVEKSGKEARQ